MRIQISRHELVLGVLAVGLLFSAPAFAGPDRFHPSSANWSVNSTPAGNITNAFSVGTDGHTTLNTDVHAGDLISVLVGWAIEDRSGLPGTTTSYPRTISFAAATTQKPPGAPDVSVAAISDCTVTSAASTCLTGIQFAAPATAGNYQVRIRPDTGPGAGSPLDAFDLLINFTVADTALLIDTKLTVEKHCYLLNAGDVDLNAKLEELLSGDAIAGQDIDFYLNPEDPPSHPIGWATTDTNGVATLVYDINGLGVGDYNLYAEYGGSTPYDGSNDSNTLGISYLFVGFQQPINPEGNSIFGAGRVIPIKVKVVDASLQPVPDAMPTVHLYRYSEDNVLGEELEAPTSVSAADTGNTMRYVPADGHYIYNWDLSNLENGTYVVVVNLGDSSACSQGPYYALITVEKKGGKKK